jgi:hypothetical protein
MWHSKRSMLHRLRHQSLHAAPTQADQPMDKSFGCQITKMSIIFKHVTLETFYRILLYIEG